MNKNIMHMHTYSDMKVSDFIILCYVINIKTCSLNWKLIKNRLYVFYPNKF